MSDPRATAARTLTQVIRHGRSLSDILPGATQAAGDDRALVREMVYGTLRWFHRLDAILKRLLQRPLRPKDTDVRALLLLGLYQLQYMRIPPHAAVGETVQAARALGKSWASALVNGVLRRFLRERDTLLDRLKEDEQARLSHPSWLLQRLHEDWPGHWRDIASAANGRAPMTLRVNPHHGSRRDYATRLDEAGIACTPHPLVASALTLERPLEVERLPGFGEGAVSVQDAAAQLAAPLLDIRAGQRILDACAAPGGKTGHILELATEGVAVTALDHDGGRLQRVAENLRRLGREATLIAADAAEPGDWWDGASFDRILLDAPCSATGVIRRHPDIKLLRKPGDITTLVTTQARLLDALWPLLAPGGMLLYATCSVLQAENEQSVGAFLSRHEDASERPIEAGWGQARQHGRQILPGQDGMDGFYYACIVKNT
jgi:16S rRNA (cytosine967-C5)-methyltransferase